MFGTNNCLLMKVKLAELKIPYFKMMLFSTEESGFLRRYLERIFISCYTLRLWISHGRMCIPYCCKNWDCLIELCPIYLCPSSYDLGEYSKKHMPYMVLLHSGMWARRLSQSNSSLTALPWKSISYLYALGLVFQNAQLEWIHSAWENSISP